MLLCPSLLTYTEIHKRGLIATASKSHVWTSPKEKLLSRLVKTKRAAWVGSQHAVLRYLEAAAGKAAQRVLVLCLKFSECGPCTAYTESTHSG